MDVDVYGLIDDEFVGDLRRKIARSAPDETITLHISSRGGGVGAGVTAYNVLRASGRPVRAVMDGDAMSAASLLVCAADQCDMPNNTLLMIHDPWLPPSGPLTIQEAATVHKYLRATKAQAVEIYAQKTQQSKRRLSELMRRETYFNAQEAMAEGFVSNVIGESKIVENLKLDDYPVRDREKLGLALAQRRIPRDVSELLKSIGID
jgi:ATP-dependent protease ClpP protease subunit